MPDFMPPPLSTYGDRIRPASEPRINYRCSHKGFNAYQSLLIPAGNGQNMSGR